jgi:hypothetical protein
MRNMEDEGEPERGGSLPPSGRSHARVRSASSSYPFVVQPGNHLLEGSDDLARSDPSATCRRATSPSPV